MASQGIHSRVSVAAGRRVVQVRLQRAAAQGLSTGGRGASQLAKQQRQSSTDNLAGGKQQDYRPAINLFPLQQSASQTIPVQSARVSPARPHLQACSPGIPLG